MEVAYGSLFSGIGGLDMAMEACGWNPAWQVENDSFCSKILERHWPDVRRYGDIREVDWRSVERVELVCGGFPCQPFSVAGHNRGVDDERNLWPETIRAVRDLGPRYVFLENVPGLLAHGYFGIILGDLAEGGYDAVWDTFTAAEVGASHRRKRLFILAYSTDPRHRAEVVGGEAGRQDSTRSPSGTGRPSGDVAYPTINIRRTLGDDGRQPSDGASDWDVADADAGRHGEQATAVCPRGNADFSSSRSLGHTEGELGQGRAEPAGRSGQALPGRSGAPVADTASGRQRTGLRVDDAGQPYALGRFPPGPDDRDAWARVLTEVPTLEPAVCRVATGVPDRTHRLRALGNAVVPAQGAYAFRALWQRMMA